MWELNDCSCPYNLINIYLLLNLYRIVVLGFSLKIFSYFLRVGQSGGWWGIVE